MIWVPSLRPRSYRADSGRYFQMVLVLILSVSAAYANHSHSGATSDKNYIIKPEDTLEIFIWKEPELSRKVSVRPDGMISIPLVQDVQASGLTPYELKKSIEDKLKNFISSPNATVIIDSILSYKIFVTGRVTKPGAFQLQKPVTVLQALSLAGGFQNFASVENISILRNSNGKSQVFEFNYKDVIRGKSLSENILLESGDVVVVP